jgi:hypothetical protein
VLIGLVLVATATLVGWAMLVPARPARPAPVDLEARRRRFDGAVEMLRQQGFKTDRLLIGYDGAAALFVGEDCGRACILRPLPERKIAVEFRDMRTLAAAEAFDVVVVAPDTGFIGRLRGDLPPGTRQIVGADLRVRFEAAPDLPETEVLIRFGPDGSSPARIASSVLRGQAESLRFADEEAEAKARARADAAARRTQAEAAEASARKRAEAVAAEDRRQAHLKHLRASRR